MRRAMDTLPGVAQVRQLMMGQRRPMDTLAGVPEVGQAAAMDALTRVAQGR